MSESHTEEHLSVCHTYSEELSFLTLNGNNYLIICWILIQVFLREDNFKDYDCHVPLLLANVWVYAKIINYCRSQTTPTFHSILSIPNLLPSIT